MAYKSWVGCGEKMGYVFATNLAEPAFPPGLFSDSLLEVPRRGGGAPSDGSRHDLELKGVCYLRGAVFCWW